MKFIIVDDEEINLIIARKVLNLAIAEAEVVCFKGAGEALRYFSNRSKDCSSEIILLLDLNMPVLTGWDFLDFFDEFEDSLKRRVQIYILSSSIDPVDKARALTYSNVIAFISKPVTPSIIREYFVAANKTS